MRDGAEPLTVAGAWRAAILEMLAAEERAGIFDRAAARRAELEAEARPQVTAEISACETSVAEIARVLGVPIATIHAAVVDAASRLRAECFAVGDEARGAAPTSTTAGPAHPRLFTSAERTAAVASLKVLRRREPAIAAALEARARRLATDPITQFLTEQTRTKGPT